MNKTILWVGIIALALSGCGGAGKPNDSSAVPLAQVPPAFAGKVNPGGDVEEGARLFEENCAPCHGVRGDGVSDIAAAINPPPANLVELQKRAGDDYLFWRIYAGKEGTAMAPWNHLDEEQIWSLVSYIRSLK